MCVESLSIALCAPTKVPSLSFTCGRLHLIVGHRQICEEAKGRCVCFLGTCGTLLKSATPNSVDWTGVPKIRCLACTKREDHVGDGRDGRELVESPLLTRNAISESEQDTYATTLRDLWQGQDSCPYHKVDEAVVEDAARSTPTSSLREVRPSSTPEGSVAVSLTSCQVKAAALTDEDPFKPKRGLAASQWAKAPDFSPKFTPAPRRPILIVRPPSEHSVKSSPGMTSTKSCQSESPAASPSLSLANPSACASMPWVPPHLRYRGDTPTIAVTAGTLAA